VQQLKADGYMTSKSIVAGTSGGALGALVACSGLRCEDALEAMIEQSTSSQTKQNIDLGLRQGLLQLFSHGDEKAILDSCNGKLHVVVCKVYPLHTSPLIVSHFEDVPNLLDVVCASCFIPLWSSPRQMYTRIHAGSPKSFPQKILPSDLVLDGGFLAFMPPIGDVRLSPFPARYILTKKPHISLDVNAYSLPRLLSWVLQPAPPSVLRELYEHGKTEAKKWIEMQEETRRA